jgi:hypothetical protein
MGSGTKAYMLLISPNILAEFTRCFHGIPNFSSGGIQKWQKTG